LKEKEVNPMTQATTSTETIDVKGGHLVEKLKELMHEGNVRQILIKDVEGKTVMEVPVTVGVLGLLAAPKMAALGALAALAADYSIDVERDGPRSPAVQLHAGGVIGRRQFANDSGPPHGTRKGE
jgi:hypothetical protein